MNIIVKPKLMREIISTNFDPYDTSTSPNQFELYLESLVAAGVDVNGQIFVYKNRLYQVEVESE